MADKQLNLAQAYVIISLQNQEVLPPWLDLQHVRLNGKSRQWLVSFLRMVYSTP